MRSETEIKAKIEHLKDQSTYWKQKQSEYRWTEKEREEGSTAYGSLQEKEAHCQQQIRLLEWVLV